MPSTETASRMNVALLKYPTRAARKAHLSRIPPRQVEVQINNQTKMVHSQQTLFDAAHNHVDENIAMRESVVLGR